VVRGTRDVVVTGCGAWTSLGLGVPALWDGLLSARVALAQITRFDADDLTPNVAGEVPWADDDPDRAGALALGAAREALQDAGLDRLPSRSGVAVGTTLGGMAVFEAWGAAVATGCHPPPSLDRVPYYAPAARLASTFGVRGPVATPQLACASGTHAVALGATWIRAGRADVVIAGGADLLCRFVVAGFNCLRATSDEARPFDRERKGLVLGEGAAVIVLEARAHAERRGARIRARVAGVGAAADAVHMTAPDRSGGGAARAIGAALRDAGVDPAAIGFVSAHGTGTPYNDAMEARAIGAVFGRGRVPVNSIKGAIGHTLGAAGAIEAVLCVRVLETGFVPPTAGLRDPDPACAELDLICGRPRTVDASTVVSTSSGFAGANAAVVMATP
jgi:3-oxoacyl-[acyl-carrier-protein] synthase II